MIDQSVCVKSPDEKAPYKRSLRLMLPYLSTLAENAFYNR